tara:strand:- start:792 stop:1157 length:366 start_codon:yes stop_codon:yes gene_type:complete
MKIKGINNMKFLIIRNNETIGGLNIEVNEDSLIDFNQDLDWFLESKLKEFFEGVINDFQHNIKNFEFLGLREKLINLDLWNKCEIDIMTYNDCFEAWITGDDGILELKIKPLNNIRFFEVK